MKKQLQALIMILTLAINMKALTTLALLMVLGIASMGQSRQSLPCQCRCQKNGGLGYYYLLFYYNKSEEKTYRFFDNVN